MIMCTSIKGGIITMARKGIMTKTMAKGMGFLILDKGFQTILSKLIGQWSIEIRPRIINELIKGDISITGVGIFTQGIGVIT